MWWISASGLYSLKGPDALQHEPMRVDPALGFLLLQGCGTRSVRTDTRNIRGLDTADDRQLLARV